MLTVQRKKDTTPPTWPAETVPMQMHLDFKVPTVAESNAIVIAPSGSAPLSSTIARPTTMNRSMCWPIRRATRSAYWCSRSNRHVWYTIFTWPI